MPSAEVLRIARGSTVTETPIAVGIASGAFLGANANRIALTISPAFANNVTISSKATAVLGQGINIPALQDPVRITLEDYGPLLQGAWTAIASAATTVSVFEESSTAG